MNKIQKAVAEFERKNGALARKVSTALIDAIHPDDSPATIIKKVDAIYKRFAVKAETKNLLLAHIVDAASLGVGAEIGGVASFKRWYTENAYSPSGVKFSEAINDLVRVPEIKAQIVRSMKAGQSWREAAQNLSDRRIQVADVAGDVRKVLDGARKAYDTTADAEGFAAYKRAVQRRINRLTDPDTSQLKRAYQDILDLTQSSSAAQASNAIKYASYYKQRYNSERIARTEMARAYGDAAFADTYYDEDVVGIKFMLSSAHPEIDICDYHTGADLFGMGAGVYPKTHAPEYPFHPHCLCSIVKIYQGETRDATAEDYDRKGGTKYLKSLSGDERRKLLGVDGAQAFEEKPGRWEKDLKQWKAPEEKKPLIPKSKLYGK